MSRAWTYVFSGPVAPLSYLRGDTQSSMTTAMSSAATSDGLEEQCRQELEDGSSSSAGAAGGGPAGATADIDDEILRLEEMAKSLDRDVAQLRTCYEDQLRRFAATALDDAICVPPLRTDLSTAATATSVDTGESVGDDDDDDDDDRDACY